MLLRKPEILGLHVVRQVGREKQLHLKVRVTVGNVELVLDVLIDTGAQVSLVRTGLLPCESLQRSGRPVRLKVANGQYMSGGTREAMLALDFIQHKELSHPDLGCPISLEGLFYEADMEWDMIMGYNFMVTISIGVLPAQESMTLYRDDCPVWLLTTNHQVTCAWIDPEQDQIEKAIRTIRPAVPPWDEYGFRPEMVPRGVDERELQARPWMDWGEYLRTFAAAYPEWVGFYPITKCPLRRANPCVHDLCKHPLSCPICRLPR